MSQKKIKPSTWELKKTSIDNATTNEKPERSNYFFPLLPKCQNKQTKNQSNNTQTISQKQTENLNDSKEESISDFFMHLLAQVLDMFLHPLWNILFGKWKSCDSSLRYH